LELFISATFLALVIQTVHHGIYEVEIYIILLITFGAYLFIIPSLLWRLATGCQPLLDPSRLPLVDPG
jgi:tellurite resistance protein TehA-like permease